MKALRGAVLAGYMPRSAMSGRAEELFGNPDPRVRSAALGALHRQGWLTPERAAGALGDPDPLVRRRVCELAGASPGSYLGIGELVGALEDPDPLVAEMAAWALGEHGAVEEETGEESVTTGLSAMASGHPDPLCREAAVGALGARADPTTLATVISALEDRPAIRRRAAVALAAFDDPAADEALRSCLADRDWQVRQVAEELLA